MRLSKNTVPGDGRVTASVGTVVGVVAKQENNADSTTNCIGCGGVTGETIAGNAVSCVTMTDFLNYGAV